MFGDTETVERRRRIDTTAHRGEERETAAAAEANCGNLAVAEPLFAEPVARGLHISRHHAEIERLQSLPGLGMVGIVVGDYAWNFRAPE